MLFGDEKRFDKTYVAHSMDSRIHGVKATATDETVGPGSYFSNGLDYERNGWIKKSFSRREPMTPPARYSVFGRNDSFTTGVLTSYGTLSAPKSPKDVLSSPGPGYYDRSVFSFGSSSLSPNNRTLSTPRSSPRSSRPHSANNSVAGYSQASIPLSTSKRFLFDQSATLKDGVLFLSAENNYKETGPGYYSYNMDTLNKPSHNVRAKSPNPTRSFVSVSSPRSSQSGRPRSASSGRLRYY